MKMRFIVKNVGNGGERIGTLSSFTHSPNTVIETPTAALHTRGGSVAHLTADVLARVFTKPQLLWMPLSNCHQLENGIKAQGEGITKFAGISGHIACTTLQDISEETPVGHFERDNVPLWTRNGKKMLSANRYMEIMEIFKPDIILAMADGRVAIGDGPKRISKSVQRTSTMLDVCVNKYKESPKLQESALIGVIVGGSHETERKRSIEKILAHKDVLTGIALSGITAGGNSTQHTQMNQLVPVLKSVENALPPNLLRVMEGCWNPAVVVSAIAHGWDLFDGTYPAKLTNCGQALVLNFESTETSKELCILDFNDTKYKETFEPISSQCTCLTCTKHTRAYIHHLIVTQEMLAQVLLNIHNLHHYDIFFQQVRRHIASNTFHDFKELITNQYELYKLSQTDTDLVESKHKDNTKKKRFRENDIMN